MFFNRNKEEVTNHEGARAVALSDEMQLYTLVCSSVLNEKFYESATEQLHRMQVLVASVSPEFTASLAIYAREQMYLRTVPLVLTVLLSQRKDFRYLKALTQRVVQRADELTDLLVIYQALNQRSGIKKLNKLSRGIQKGLAAALPKFDAYQLAKYNRKGAVTLKDVIRLTHPHPDSEERSLLYKQVLEDTLPTPYTWETRLSQAGQQGESQTEVWQELIDSQKVGYMALLRNLRNILQAGVSESHLDQVLQRLADPKEVLKSKQLPFRYYSAYRSVDDLNSPFAEKVVLALEEALLLSMDNLELLQNKKVVIAADVSGSMQTNVSSKSVIQYYDIGLILAMLAHARLKDSITGIFGDTWKVKTFPRESVLRNVAALRQIEGEVGYSTNGFEVLKWALLQKVKADLFLFFTDCQMWDSTSGANSMATWWESYKKFQPQAQLVLFDLAGHGTSPVQILSQNVCLVGGWSDRVFEMLSAISKGSEALEKVKAIKLSAI